MLSLFSETFPFIVPYTWTLDTEQPHFRSLVKLVWRQVVSKEVLAGTEIPWGRLYLTLHCHHQNDFCIKMGSNESHSDVSLIVRGIVTRQYPQKKWAEAKSNQSPVYQTNTFTPRPNWLTSFCCITWGYGNFASVHQNVTGYLQYPGDFGVSVRNVVGFLFGIPQWADHITQGQQTGVDVDGLWKKEHCLATA